MNGSYSIKYVLPGFVLEMEKGYKALNSIPYGSQAMQAFANLLKLDDNEKEKMRNALLA